MNKAVELLLLDLFWFLKHIKTLIYLIWVISFWKDRTKSQLPLFQENVSQGVFLKMCCSVKEESTAFAAELCLSHGAYVKCRCALVESRSLFLNGMYPYRSLNWWIWGLEDLSLWSDTNIYSRSEFAFTCLPEMKCLFVSPFLSAVVDIYGTFMTV